jgi:small-conductance mechanosensitive channel
MGRHPAGVVVRRASCSGDHPGRRRCRSPRRSPSRQERHQPAAHRGRGVHPVPDRRGGDGSSSASIADVSDNLQARAVYTQVVVLKKVSVTIIFTLASMLMVFDSVRQFGASILASAGVAGIVIGFAAQRSIATLLAGFQIALTQPIRLDDVVIVENEWGRIEEITLTYVVVRVWDLRRLVVPIAYFIEQPFQN